MKLSPQEARVLALFQAYSGQWLDENQIRRAIHEPDGTPRWTPPRIVVCKLRKALKDEAVRIDTESRQGRRGGTSRYRLVETVAREQAA